ncbi:MULTISPECIES: hypothetical protein [unclassified Streptomyces]|uniref:hypothetical protein n=1 Tax=unclassified Streptomyces TaxID=2593676 RepID=UPI002E2BCDB1|nr:hypothetical protein [Streptomyces sp. NBC_00223]
MTTLPSFFAAATSAPVGDGQRLLTSPVVPPLAVESEPDPESELEPHAVAAKATAIPAQISFQLR